MERIQKKGESGNKNGSLDGEKAKKDRAMSMTGFAGVYQEKPEGSVQTGEYDADALPNASMAVKFGVDSTDLGEEAFQQEDGCTVAFSVSVGLEGETEASPSNAFHEENILRQTSFEASITENEAAVETLGLGLEVSSNPYALLVNTTTPDWYDVDADGRWIP